MAKFGDGTINFGKFGGSPVSVSQVEEVDMIVGDPEEDAEKVVGAKRAHRRTKACTELSQRYEYRRAFSEIKMLEAMEYVRLQKGTTYNFITAGDVDSLSYLKVVLNQHNLDHLLLSTWCMGAEDILQVQQWHEEGRIKKIDMSLGEKFIGEHDAEFEPLVKFPELGLKA